MKSASKGVELWQDITGDDALAKRQREWLHRDTSSSTTSFRPVELFRPDAKHSSITLDNQISPMTWLAWSLTSCSAKYVGGCRTWLGMSVAIGLGHSSVSAAHALLYKWTANMFLWPGESHSVNNSFSEVVSEVEQNDLWLLLLIKSNLEFGPRSSEERRHQIRNLLSACYDNRTRKIAPSSWTLSATWRRSWRKGVRRRFLGC